MTASLFALARQMQLELGTRSAALFLRLRGVPVELALAALTGRTA